MSDNEIKVEENSVKTEGNNVLGQLTGGPLNLIAESLIGEFKSIGAESFIELNFEDPNNPGEKYSMTLQRMRKVTPGKRLEILKESVKNATEYLEMIPLHLPDDTDPHVGHLLQSAMNHLQAILDVSAKHEAKGEGDEADKA